MNIADVTQPFFQTPLAVTLIGVACATMVTLAAASLKIVIQLARLQDAVAGLREDVTSIKVDPDIMRWSTYGRATQANLPAPHIPGVHT
jgi:hypothetical protein